MGEQAMVAEVDAENAEDVIAHDREDQPRPAEEPRQEGQERDQVIADDQGRRNPSDMAHLHGSRRLQPRQSDRRRGRFAIHKLGAHRALRSSLAIAPSYPNNIF